MRYFIYGVQCNTPKYKYILECFYVLNNLAQEVYYIKPCMHIFHTLNIVQVTNRYSWMVI